MIYIDFFFFNRMFYAYNDIYRFMATAFFMFVTLSMCSLMLAIQMELVEYFCFFIAFILSLKVFLLKCQLF